jgi:hypothetical protein
MCPAIVREVARTPEVEVFTLPPSTGAVLTDVPSSR